MFHKVYSEGKYISTLRTKIWFLFYVSSTVSSTVDTRLRKGVGKSGAVKRLISCNNFLVSLDGMCLKFQCVKMFLSVSCKCFYSLVFVLDMFPKFYSEANYIVQFWTEKGFPFYVNYTVTIKDTRLRKGAGTSRAAKRIISCVNLLVNLKNQRYRENLVTVGEKNIYLQDLKLPSTRNALCLWVRCCVCIFDVFWYFCCLCICFRIYWLIIMIHF